MADKNEIVEKIKSSLQKILDESGYKELNKFVKEEGKLRDKIRYQFVEIFNTYDDFDSKLEELYAEVENLCGSSTLNEVKMWIAMFAKSANMYFNDEFKDNYISKFKEYVSNPIEAALNIAYYKKKASLKANITNDYYDLINQILNIINLVEKGICLNQTQIEKVYDFISESSLYDKVDIEFEGNIITREVSISDSQKFEFLKWFLTSTTEAWKKVKSPKIDERQVQIEEGIQEITSEIVEIPQDNVEKDFLTGEQRELVDAIKSMEHDSNEVNPEVYIYLDLLNEDGIEELILSSSKYADLVYLMKLIIQNESLLKDNTEKIFGILKRLHEKAIKLKEAGDKYRKNLEELENEESNNEVLRIAERTLNRGYNSSISSFASSIKELSLNDEEEKTIGMAFENVVNAEEFETIVYEVYGSIQDYFEKTSFSFLDYVKYQNDEKILELYFEYKETSDLEDKKKLIAQMKSYIDKFASIESTIALFDSPKAEDDYLKDDKRLFLFLTDKNNQIYANKLLDEAEVGKDVKKDAKAGIRKFRFCPSNGLTKNEVLTSTQKTRYPISAFRNDDIRTCYIRLTKYLSEDILKYISHMEREIYLVVGQVYKKNNKTRSNRSNQKTDDYDLVTSNAVSSIIDDYIKELETKLKEIIDKCLSQGKTEEEIESTIEQYFEYAEWQYLKEYDKNLGLEGESL